MNGSARYHPGELAAQRRAGVVEQAEHSRGAIGAGVPPAAVEFLAEQPALFVGAADQQQRMWASLLTGPPGFVRVSDAATVHVAARPLPADPLAAVLDHPAQVGTLAIEPATRRRMRLNGRSAPAPGGLIISAEQVYANCPKYIQQRSPLRSSTTAAPPGPGSAATSLTTGHRALIASADTFFVATHAASGDADVSHRGGRPGFVQVVSSNELRWPDYVGNAMMMTLGNLQQDPAAGLLFVDWQSGTTLQLTGTAAVEFDPADAADLPGAQRAVRFHLTQAVRIDHASPLTWTAPVFSRFNPPAPATPSVSGVGTPVPAVAVRSRS